MLINLSISSELGTNQNSFINWYNKNVAFENGVGTGKISCVTL
jgi:hypothetical protein